MKGNSNPFGGVQVIAAGSFVQLPPVPSSNDNGDYAFQSEQFKNVFPHRITLNSVMRQKDSDLIAAINDLCEGNPSANTHRLMSSLQRDLANFTEPVYIFGTNYDVDFFNNMKLEVLRTDDVLYTSEDIGNLNWLRKTGAPRFLLLKPECKIIVTRNLDTGLVNGLSGHIIRCSDKSVVIKVDEDKYLNHGFGGKEFEISLYTFVARDASNEIKAVRKQLPLKLGYAVTVHKAQGRSLDEVIIDSSSFWRPGQLGVAVGRATTKEGLQLSPYNKYAATLRHPQVVVDFYQERSLLMKQDLTCCKKCTLREPTTFERNYVHYGPENAQAVGNDCDYMNRVTLKSFPFDVEQYLDGVIQEMPKVTHIQKDQIQILTEAKGLPSFHQFLDRTYSMIWDLFHKYKVFVKKSKCNWCQMCAHLHSVFASEAYKQNILKAFGITKLHSHENSLCTRLVFDLLNMIVKEEALKIKKMHMDQFLDQQKEGPNLDSLDLSTLRYIAGASIHSVITKVRQLSMKQIMNSKYKAKMNHRKSQLASKLIGSKYQLESECIEPESLLKLIEKDRGGLLYVTDNCFYFFKNLLVKIRKFQNLMQVQMEPNTAFINAMKAISVDSELADMWFNLFSETHFEVDTCTCDSEREHTEEDDVVSNNKLIDMELDQLLILDLYEQVTFYFCKVHFREKVEQLRDYVFQKQKTFQLRHRADIDSANTKSVQYPCGECKNECIEIIHTSQAAFEDFSVQCDKCSKWYHYMCLNLSGNEPELKDGSDLPFYCKHCNKNASQDDYQLASESSVSHAGTGKAVTARATGQHGRGHGRGRGRPKSSSTEQSAKTASTTYDNKSKNPEPTNVSSRGRIRKSVVKLDI